MIKLRSIYSIIFITVLGILAGFSQVTTIVNYDFNSGTTYGTLTPALASGISCSVNGLDAYSILSGGTATGINAFTSNATGGNALAMTNSSGTNTRYFQFHLGGADLSLYHTYKLYCQAARGGAGATTITAAYSMDGITYTNFSPTKSTGLGSASECLFDLSAITALNLQSTVYFRLLASGASGSGVMAIDNFQIRATKCTTPANISAGSNQTITCGSTSAVLTGSSSTSGVTYSWSPGGATTSSNTVTAVGTYTLKLTDPANGCFVTSTVSVSQNVCATANITDSIGQIDLIITGGVPPYNVAWNGVKFPSFHDAYAMLSIMGYPVTGDSVIIKQQYDSIVQRTSFSGLNPGRYPITIYDQLNDSVNVTGVIGSETDTLLAKGITISSSPSYHRVSGNRTYFYEETKNISQSGIFAPPPKNYAVMANRIMRNEENYMEFGIPDTTRTIYGGLRDTTQAVSAGSADVKQIACFEFIGSAYSVWVNNVKQYTGTYNPGDVFAISTDPVNNLMHFYKNDVAVYNYALNTVSGGSEFRLKFIHGSAGGLIKNIKVIGPAIRLRDNIFAAITDVTCGNPCGGAIDATAFIQLFPVVPVSYELYYGTNPIPVAMVNDFSGGDHALFSGLCAGKYTVKYCYTTGKSYDHSDPYPMSRTSCITQVFEIAYMPDWVNVTSNVNVSSDKTLTKASGLAFDWDAGASSLNFLESADDGWIEWNSSTVESLNGIGFSTTDADPTINTINYGVGYMNMTIMGLWKYYVKTHNETMLNSVIVNANPLQPYSGNVKFRIEKTGTTITILMNGLPVNSFTGVPLQGFMVDASLKKLLGTITHPRVSFGCKGLEQYTMLRKKLDGGYYTAYNRRLLFKYDEEYADKDGLLTFNIYDKNNKVIMTNLSVPGGATPVVSYGDNRYSIDIGDASYLVSGQTMPTNSFYILEVINEKKEKWYLRFKK